MIWEARYTATGYLLLQLKRRPTMIALKLLRLTHSNLGRDLEEWTLRYLSVVMTSITMACHCLSQLGYQYQITKTFKTLSGASMEMNASYLRRKALHDLLALHIQWPLLPRPRVFAGKDASEHSQTTLIIWRTHSLSRQSWDLTVHRSRGRSQDQRRGYLWMKSWHQETASVVLECSGLLVLKLNRLCIFEGAFR